MFRIRKILDNTSAANRAAIDQVLQILTEQFPNVRSEELTKLPQQLNDPLKYKYRSILFIAENGTGKVYPVVNNLYATPVKPGDQDLYFLMMDGLGREVKIGRKLARKVVRAILERKYGDLISAAQIDEVVGSFRDDPRSGGERRPQYPPCEGLRLCRGAGAADQYSP